MTTPTPPTIDSVVAKYIELRDKLARMKADYEAEIAPIKGAMDKIENYLLGRANELGVDSFKTEHGTAYTSSRTSVKVADKDVFFNYVQEHQEWSLMEIRAAKVAVEQFVAANEEVPPGLDIVTERTLNVRRS